MKVPRNLCTLIILLFFQSAKALDPMPVIVAYNIQEYSFPLVGAATNKLMRDELGLVVEPVFYSDVVTVAAKIKSLTAEHILVLGPARSDHALKLDQLLTGITNKVVVLSPTISTTHRYTNLSFIAGCVSDTDRLLGLAAAAPVEWSSLPAAFIGEDDTWGRQMYQQLVAQFPQLKLRAAFYAKSSERPSGRYAAFLNDCKREQRSLIFVALEDSTGVNDFLSEATNRATLNTTFSPYRPAICLLSEYPFEKGRERPAVSLDFGSALPITIASEVASDTKATNLFLGLSEDFVTLVAHTRKRRPKNSDFFHGLKTVFEGGPDRRDLLADFTNSFSTSHYYTWMTGRHSDQQYQVQHKWLRLRKSENTHEPGWAPLNKNNIPFWYWFELIRARVPWLANPYLIGLFVGCLLVGLAAEFNKRYVFIRGGIGPRLTRFIVWLLIFAGFFYASVALAWFGHIDGFNFALVVTACLSPLALLPILQHAAITKVPIVEKVLEIPSNAVEFCLDRVTNSKAKRLLDNRISCLRNELEEQGKAEDEMWLWQLWLEELRVQSTGVKSERMFENGIKELRPWDGDRNPKKRPDVLIKHIAYAQIVRGV